MRNTLLQLNTPLSEAEKQKQNQSLRKKKVGGWMDRSVGSKCPKNGFQNVFYECIINSKIYRSWVTEEI